MKKVIVLLMLVGLVAGIAQAQTPQVRLVWEKTFTEGIRSFTLGEIDSLAPPEVTVVGSFKGRADQRILRIDTAGTMREVLTKRYNDPVILSHNGKYIGVNRWVYDPEYRNLPLPYVITPSGGRIGLQGECGSCEIAAISNDGQVILVAKGLGYPVEAGQISTKRETLVFYDARGQVINEVLASEYLAFDEHGEDRGKRLSPNGGYLALRQWVSKNPAKFSLGLYDGRGRKLWETDEDVGAQAGFEVSEEGTVAVGYFRSDSTGGVKFYRRDGSLLGDLNLGSKIGATQITFSPDERYALAKCVRSVGVQVTPFGESLLLLAVNPPRIIWRRDLPVHGRDKKLGFYGLDFSSNGGYVAVFAWDIGYGTGYAALYDLTNRELWHVDLQVGGTVRITPSGRYLLLQQGNQLKLYKIER